MVGGNTERNVLQQLSFLCILLRHPVWSPCLMNPSEDDVHVFEVDPCPVLGSQVSMLKKMQFEQVKKKETWTRKNELTLVFSTNRTMTSNQDSVSDLSSERCWIIVSRSSTIALGSTRSALCFPERTSKLEILSSPALRFLGLSEVADCDGPAFALDKEDALAPTP